MRGDPCMVAVGGRCGRGVQPAAHFALVAAGTRTPHTVDCLPRRHTYGHALPIENLATTSIIERSVISLELRSLTRSIPVPRDFLLCFQSTLLRLSRFGPVRYHPRHLPIIVGESSDYFRPAQYSYWVWLVVAIARMDPFMVPLMVHHRCSAMHTV